MRTLVLAVAALSAAAGTTAQDSTASRYRTPPAPIADFLSAASAPLARLDPQRRTLLLIERDGLPDIVELAGPELRLAGQRIDPRTNASSRTTPARALAFVDLASGQRRAIDLPPGARIGFLEWSPDGERVAFASTVEDGVELWVADVADARARRVLDARLSAVLGAPFEWLPDGSGLVVRLVPADRGEPPVPPRVPAGPVVQEGSGRAAPVQTYQDRLASPHDERLFEYYFTAQLARLSLQGEVTPFGEPALISGFDVAPGGEHVLVTAVQRPFSYSTTINAFGARTYVLSLDGEVVFTLEDRREVQTRTPGRDAAPSGPRAVQWRADAPATLAWVEATADGEGVRDRLRALVAPFHGTPRTLIELEQRFSGVQWGTDDVALVTAYAATTGRTYTWLIRPGRERTEPQLLIERSAADRYGDPGAPLTTTRHGEPVLQLSGDRRAFYLAGAGASAKGTHPFLDRLEFATGKATRLWQAVDPWHESVFALLDDDARLIITQRESRTEPPNFWLRDLQEGTLARLTHYPDPAPQLSDIGRQVVTYRRADGIPLSGTLYTPADYDAARDGPLPLLLWAYPRAYRDASAAAQVTGASNRFSRPSGMSHLYLLTQGYAVLDGPGMPIVPQEGAEPNDTYVEQLVANARAAIDAVVALGVGDRERVAVGGHSYGAAMTANLLAHSDLFRAGIALSGAYNRTLTPFGFQAEPRSYWQAGEAYRRMSPFEYADRITAPLLLVHGEADSNTGTYPMQSERMYQAIRGNGGHARLVMLPHEGHSYVSRQSVLHVLAEMVDWLDRHVKPRPDPG